MTPAANRLAQTRRRAVEREIEDVALGLFLERGFTSVTMDDVAAAVGTSRSSLFRYFPTKEDILLVSMRETGRRLADTLRDRPAHESAWQAVTVVLLGFAGEFDAGADAARRRARLLADTPSLQQSLAGKHRDWQLVFAEELLPRITGRAADRHLKAQAVAACALACLDAAATEWARADAGPSLVKRLGRLYEITHVTA
jgi:AcrR family transcriptional regulator